MTSWFGRCYRLDVDAMSGRAEWQLAFLPGPGSLGEQDARLMNALSHCAEMANLAIRDDEKDAQRRRAREKAKKEREAARG